MAHLRQRNNRTAAAPAVPINPPGSNHSTRPRVLSFTPQATPRSRLGTPLARQLGTPLGEQPSVGPMPASRFQKQLQSQEPPMPLGELLAHALAEVDDGDTSSSNAGPVKNAFL